MVSPRFCWVASTLCFGAMSRKEAAMKCLRGKRGSLAMKQDRRDDVQAETARRTAK